MFHCPSPSGQLEVYMTIQQLLVSREDLVGRYVAEIGLGAGTVSLRLAGLGRPGTASTALVVISASAVLHMTNQDHELAPTPASVTALAPLLNEDVTDAQIDADSRVCIYFGADRFIEICRDANGLESASINVPGRDGLVI